LERARALEGFPHLGRATPRTDASASVIRLPSHSKTRTARTGVRAVSDDPAGCHAHRHWNSTSYRTAAGLLPARGKTRSYCMELRGIEPLTSAVRLQRTPSCARAPRRAWVRPLSSNIRQTTQTSSRHAYGPARCGWGEAADDHKLVGQGTPRHPLPFLSA